MASLAEQWGTEARPGGRRRADGEKQLTLDRAKTLGRGGRRENAGRPKKERESGRAQVPHAARAKHKATTPVHVTMRRVDGLPSFRLTPLHDEIVSCIRDIHSDTFRIVHYSIQSNHIHVLLEAADDCLDNGIRGFAVSVTRRVNGRVLRRRGKLWEGRYHRHDLLTPSEVRRALVYVLSNGFKHNEVQRGELDPCSSARWFDGWISGLPAASDLSIETRPVRPPETWLLRVGWTKVFPGYLLPSEAPKAAARPK